MSSAENQDPKKVLVIGGTGRLGKEILREALRKGHNVRAITRDMKKAQTYEEGQIEWQQCDATDKSCMLKATDGRDAVISSIGPKGLGKTSVYSDSIKVVLETMKENRVNRLLCVSSEWDSPAVSGLTKKALLYFLGNIKNDMVRMEEVLKERPHDQLKWTCVRAFSFKKDPFTGKYRVGPSNLEPIFKPETRHQDMAHFLVKEMTENNWTDDNKLTNGFVTIGY